MDAFPEFLFANLREEPRRRSHPSACRVLCAKRHSVQSPMSECENQDARCIVISETMIPNTRDRSCKKTGSCNLDLPIAPKASSFLTSELEASRSANPPPPQVRLFSFSLNIKGSTYNVRGSPRQPMRDHRDAGMPGRAPFVSGSFNVDDNENE